MSSVKSLVRKVKDYVRLRRSQGMGKEVGTT